MIAGTNFLQHEPTSFLQDQKAAYLTLLHALQDLIQILLINKIKKKKSKILKVIIKTAKKGGNWERVKLMKTLIPL